jgi:YihY family inner membrane protein
MNEPSPKKDSMMVTRRIRLHPTALLRMLDRFGQGRHRIWAVPFFAFKMFLRIDGAQWAGAFAFNVFFSLFPLMILLVTIASFFIDRNRAGSEVIAYIKNYVPIGGEMQLYIFNTIAGVINARGQAGVVAFFILVWAALQCFTTLICATNRAWGTVVYNWWRLPLRSLALLGITAGSILLGMAVPLLMRIAKGWLFAGYEFRSWVYGIGSFSISLLVVFLGLSLFYKFAPRRPARFSEVWVAALCATVLLRAGGSLFVIYLKNFATLNAVYGAFGGIMAFLLWIYISGCVFIFGACLCVGQAEMRSLPAKTTKAGNDKRNRA